MFSLNEKVVYPGHGVAQVVDIIEQEIGDIKTKCYVLKFLNKDAKVLVPINSADSVKIRPLCSTQHIADALKILAEPARKISHQEFVASSWHRRYKDCLNKMRTGEIEKITEIYRDLRFMEAHKELSFGEKALLQQTEYMLSEEISLVRKVDQALALEQLRALCCLAKKANQKRVQS